MSRAGNGFTNASFSFFAELAKNNDREWFDDHRDAYESHIRSPFIDLLETLTDRLENTPMPLVGGPQTMFRITRDLRFTNDKRPYNEQVSALMTLSGSKDESGRLAYLYVGAEGGGVGGGMHRPKASALEPVRRRILDEPHVFESILQRLAAVDAGLDRSETVKTMPRGFESHDDHRLADVIRLKQLLVMRPLPKSSFLDDSVVERIVEAIKALAPLYEFIEGA